MSAFSLHDYTVEADRDGDMFIDCPNPIGQPCHRLPSPDNGWSLAQFVAAAQAHHEQHHRDPHLMDREVTA